jgi:hypothetical protein
MTSLSLPSGGNAMWLEQAPTCLRLDPAFDGARITVELKAWVQGPEQDQIPVSVAATLLAGRSHNPSEMRTLTTLHPKRLIYTQASPTHLTLSGYVSARALREVEEERQSGNLWLVLADLKATTLQGTPARIFQAGGSNLAVEVLAGQWAAELEKVSGASYAEILIPVTSDPQLSVAAGRVRKARSLIRGGEFNAATAELRQALDPVREFYRTRDVYSGASPKVSKQRTENERFAVYVQSLFGWLTSYIHDDEESIKGCEMDRPTANQALAAVAGLLHRLAHDHATANI